MDLLLERKYNTLIQLAKKEAVADRDTKMNRESASIRDYRVHMTTMLGYGPRTQGSEVLNPFRSITYTEGRWNKPKRGLSYSVERTRRMMRHMLIGDKGLPGENSEQWEGDAEKRICIWIPRPYMTKKGKGMMIMGTDELKDDEKKEPHFRPTRVLDPRTFMGSHGIFVEGLHDCLQAHTTRRAERMRTFRQILSVYEVPRDAPAHVKRLEAYSFDDNGPDGLAYRDAMISLMLSSVEIGRISSDLAVSLLQLQFSPTEHQLKCFGLDKADAINVRENAKKTTEKREGSASSTGDIDAMLDVPPKYRPATAAAAERLETKIAAVCASHSFRASNFAKRNDNYYRQRLAGHLHTRDRDGIVSR